mmetsp:Transcript_40273/g.72562  ORF Transcript_40273/g.72562 Transcript_40273/m.72562 type:complete len:84 (+) Transcript_40273:486-737(+)
MTANARCYAEEVNVVSVNIHIAMEWKRFAMTTQYVQGCLIDELPILLPLSIIISREILQTKSYQANSSQLSNIPSRVEPASSL